MIRADRQDYKRGYKKKFAHYKKLRSTENDTNCRRLLLVYAVECGLKFLLLRQWCEMNSELIRDENKKRIIGTHDLRYLLRELGQQGNWRFDTFHTTHGDLVTAKEYHQMYRYGVRVQKDDELKEKNMEEKMMQIAEWIEERMA